MAAQAGRKLQGGKSPVKTPIQAFRHVGVKGTYTDVGKRGQQRGANMRQP